MQTLWFVGIALALFAPAARGVNCFTDEQLNRVNMATTSSINYSACAVSVVSNCDFLLHCRIFSSVASTIGSTSFMNTDEYAGEFIDLATGQDVNAIHAFWTAVTAVDQIIFTGGDLHEDGQPNATLSIAALPTASAVANLQSLKFLNMSFMNGAQLPDLSTLQSLTLSGCALTSLSPLITSSTLLRGLKTLDLSSNTLTAVPEAVYSLPNLRSLSLERNAISQTRLNVSQYEFLSALDALDADADAFQSSNCDGGGAVVYFASNPAFSVCDPAAYTTTSASSSSSSSSASMGSSSASGSQRPALIAGSVAISGGLLVALVAKLLNDRKRRRRQKELELRIRERETESSHGALATMSPPSTPVADQDDDHHGDWYHMLQGDPADDALPGVKALLERCRLASWHRDPALIVLDQPMREFLRGSDQEESRTSTTIVSSSSLRDLWLGRYRDERVAVKRVPLPCDGRLDAQRLREPALLATLAHPNVLRLRGVSYSSSLGLLVLYELMDRGDLRAYLRSRHETSSSSSSSGSEVDSARQTSWWGSRRLEIALDVARALLYLHSLQRVAHGALTSRAVLLDHEFAAKLAGFEHFQPFPDYVSTSEDAAEVPAMPPGDPSEFLSLAPELLTQEQAAANEATDVYAFGALLLELDAGLPPFRSAAKRLGWNDQELRQRLASVSDAATMDELMDVSPACPAALRILLASCLSREPHERPTATALVAVLKSVLAAATEQEDALPSVVKKKKKKRAGVSSGDRLSSGRP